MRQADINFAVTVILHALLPPSKHTSPASSAMTSARGIPQVSLPGDTSRHASILSHHKRSLNQPREILQAVVFLGECATCSEIVCAAISSASILA